MKPLHLFRWFMSAAIAALLPATIQTTAAHSMGGGHGGMPMAPNFSNGRGFGNFEQREDFAFRHHGGDRFFFDHQNRFFFGFDFAALEVWGTGFASRAILALEEALYTKASLFLISIAFMSQCLLREKVEFVNRFEMAFPRAEAFSRYQFPKHKGRIFVTPQRGLFRGYEGIKAA